MKAFRHMGIVVKDIDKMVAFYKVFLDIVETNHSYEIGKYIEKVIGIEGTEIEIVKMKLKDGSILELLKYNNKIDQGRFGKQNIYTYGLSHIAFTVKNVDNEYSKLTSQGIQFISEPEISPDGKAKVCFCMDPENNYLELVEIIGDANNE